MKKLLCILLIAILLVGGCVSSSSSGSVRPSPTPRLPYYKSFEWDFKSGYYCIDAKGTAYGEPPGYHYTECEIVQHPIYYVVNDEERVQYTPPRTVCVGKINQAAWIPFEQWPSCKMYGER